MFIRAQPVGPARTRPLNTACERHGPTCPVLVPGTARPTCPCWAEIPTYHHDTGTTRSNGRHDPRHDGRWIPATPPCDRWIPASPPFLYKGQRRPSTPPTLTLVHLHAPSSLSSLAAAALCLSLLPLTSSSTAGTAVDWHLEPLILAPHRRCSLILSTFPSSSSSLPRRRARQDPDLGTLGLCDRSHALRYQGAGSRRRCCHRCRRHLWCSGERGKL
jgi:hypothetical protein